MNTKGLKNPIFLFYLLVFYVLLQFLWWLYLIFSLYQDLYKQPDIIRQKVYMLIGEGSVFLFILIVGIIMIRRAFKREVAVNQQQQNFLLSVTHELKSPIASIKLFLQTLKKRELDEDKRTEVCEQSLTELNRLESLVKKLLLTRSIENQNFFLDLRTIQADSIIKNSVKTIQDGILSEHKTTLDLDPIEMKMDENALRSISNNLLENSAKYAPKGSEIHIELKRSDDSGVILRFTDEGKGIPDENKAIVFKKFQREENELTRKSKGTGLGLYIVKHLVEQHGGQIKLKNNKPNGLIVEIIFNDGQN